ncbi:hypothetical protein [Acidithiobacillus ferriphilus]|uniref:hypothetical protein n=1 Tax=Acidithiobacillus ferriphilus TaxID=1689834 RepID=UPI001C06F2A5|nr:hypothetical protein [Acidithiobacillus ferriphilus]MBU2833264.1 hypothetical protein [Acidithiobacillus ferriphilus]
MNAAELMTEIIQAGGEIWAEGDRLKFRDTPARLVPELRLHKTEVLAELQKCEHVNVVNMDSGLYPPDANSPQPEDDVHTDGYAIEERLAIQEESAEVSTTPDKPVLTLEEQAEAVLDRYGADWQRGVDDLRIVAKNHVLAALVEKMGIDATQPARVDSGQDMPLPERVTCGQCVRFQQGPQPLAIGRCLATVTGQPPAGNRGDYRAAFPMAPRSCPEFLGSAS